jgi:hypothetical protein
LARAIEVYARQARNTEAERQACEIRLRADRKVGLLLREREMKGAHGNPGGQGAPIVRSDVFPSYDLQTFTTFFRQQLIQMNEAGPNRSAY